MPRLIQAALFAAALLGSTAAAAQNLPSLSSTESAVTVKVTPRSLQGATWEFDVVFDTHTQELRDDLMKNAVLVMADGRQVRPVEWKADPPGSHHRKGVLRFKAIDPAPGKLELRIARPGEDKPRSFSWTVR